ncbi:hypothetical protein [Flavilitoribacter nigricans]|uniref:Uncharacterized protein n=1 Tax=Flavilitoribacter nigricans (strain ATCC 23147 / DSM 23189 / NBRC 102662 / NCIMB 1420 / SS-2) TaxID=1122177 RepID=A0A2D0MWJ7_FLAN2|nr:hypothetical protein [Flavilitoribacter nigricans]PHN00652.1 hypothetical protein CRP01_41055 [Flavilitoribacter nigricans DSM 23189 = NBRC 102662]
MNIKVSAVMRRKLKKLAELLPQPTHEIVDGEVVKRESSEEVNHYSLILKTFKNHGRAGVEMYITNFQEEWMQVREFLTQSKNEN